MDKIKIKSYLGNKGETFFIRTTGIGDFKTYHLINFDNFSMIDMFFNTEEDAKIYAKKRKLKIKKYKE